MSNDFVRRCIVIVLILSALLPPPFARPAADLALAADPGVVPVPQALFAPATVSIAITQAGLVPEVATAQVDEIVAWINQTETTVHLLAGLPYRVHLPLVLTSAGGATVASVLSQSLLAGVETQQDWGDVDILPGGTYTHTFTEAGTYLYHLSDHPDMIGRVEVYAVSQLPPNTPSNPAPADGATDQSTDANLGWTGGDPNGDAVTYDVFLEANDNAPSVIVCNDLTNTLCDPGHLSPGTHYYWQVIAQDEHGATTEGPVWDFTTEDEALPPGPFGKVSPTDGATDQSTSLTLDWDPSTGATDYAYCYDTTDDGACSSWVSTGSTTSAALSGLAYGTTYYWQVRATNIHGTTYADGSAAAYWDFATADQPTPPGPFGKVSPTDGATDQSTSLILDWDPSAGATDYAYCYDTTDDDACSSWVSTGATTSAALSGLAYGTTYYWQVRATNIHGTTYADGSAAAYWDFTTGDEPGPFGKVSPTDGATDQSTSLTLDWDPSTGATGYAYCYDTTDDDACSSWVSTGATTSAALSGLGYGTTYYWQVRATNAHGTTYADGSATAYWDFTTEDEPVPGLHDSVLHMSATNAYAYVPHSPSLALGQSPTADFTIEGFFYVPTTSYDGGPRPFVRRGSSFALEFYFRSTEPDIIHYEIRLLGFGDIVMDCYTNLQVGWHHIAIVFDNEWTADEDAMVMFLDGTRVGFSPDGSYHPDWVSGLEPSTGNIDFFGVSGASVAFPGYLEEVRISDTVRYSGANYTQPTEPFTSDPNTVALWHYDETAGTTLFQDATSYDNDLIGGDGAQTYVP